MIRNHSRSGKRSAFTLVELMVVVLIIAILVSLVSSAVLKALGKIPEVTTRTEIAEMDMALRAFMLDYNLDVPPPSYLILHEANPLLSQPTGFFQKAFGKNFGSQGPVDWNGDGQIDGPWTLEGEQCLVFYLGGIPTAPGLGMYSPQGFSTNSMNPAAISAKRKGPYYPFQVGRLAPQPYNPLIFPMYIDAWQSKSAAKPYAYFSSNGNNNIGYTQNTTPPLHDCKSIGAFPYYITGTNQYMNPNTYQIISAGKDGVFGIFGTTNPAGTAGWNPAAGAVGVGADDQANFSGSLLGSGQS